MKTNAKKSTKKSAPAATTKAPAQATRYAGKQIVVLNRKHGAREGTKRARGMDIIIGAKTTDEALPKLIKIGADASFVHFAVKSGFVKLTASKAKGGAQ